MTTRGIVTKDAADTLGVGDVWIDPLWRVRVVLSPLERDLLRTWWVRRLGHVIHAGAASMWTTQTYTRLEHSLGVLALVAHFAPDDEPARAAALLHDVGHLPLSHTFEGLAGLHHHDLGRLRVETLAPLLQRHGLSAGQVTAIAEGRTPSALRGRPGRLRVDHLDSFLRSGQAHGRTRTPPAALLQQLRLVDGEIDTDARTAAELAALIAAEARSQRSPANVVATAVTRAVADQLLERRVPSEVAAMTDDEFWGAVACYPDLARTAARLRRTPHAWLVESSNGSEGAPVGSAPTTTTHVIHRSYLDLPTVEGRPMQPPRAVAELQATLPLSLLVKDLGEP